MKELIKKLLNYNEKQELRDTENPTVQSYELEQILEEMRKILELPTKRELRNGMYGWG